MNWKKFKALGENKKNESYFIIGLDLGNYSSVIAYFDMFANAPEIIDISGGYGKSAAPTVMQYIPATREWVFGEYALLNRGVGNEITVSDLIRRLGKHAFIEVDGKPISIPGILAIFLKELILNCKNLNPKAEIAGITVAAADFLTADAIDELRLAFKIAGYEKELIELVPERLCVFTELFYRDLPKRDMRAVLLDFGGRSLRGGLYDVINPGDGVTLKNLSFLHDEGVSVNRVDELVETYFGEIYAENHNMSPALPRRVSDMISSFAYQHKDLLFQKNILAKPLKLYFNFSHPPFLKSIEKSGVDKLTAPFETGFASFLRRLFERNLYNLNDRPNPRDVDTVICAGGGFEMLWARKAVSDFFPGARIINKNSKGVIALGASLIAASSLGVIDIPRVNLEDRLKLKCDYGFTALSENRDRFIPLVEHSSFWWQDTFTRRILINREIDGCYVLGFLSRDSRGEVAKVRDLKLTGLPKRPKAAAFFDISLTFESYDNVLLSVEDAGFGELFEKTQYRQEFRFNI